MKEIFEVAGAILASIGGAGVIILALSGWLGKIWASRILGKEKKQHTLEIESYKKDISMILEDFKGLVDSKKGILNSLLSNNESIQKKKFDNLLETWEITLEIENFSNIAIGIYNFVTPTELKNNERFRNNLSNILTQEKITEHLQKSDKVRSFLPLISADLWILYSNYRSFVFRLLLIFFNLKDDFDWRNDKIIMDIINKYFKQDEIQEMNKSTFASTSNVTKRFQELILNELQKDISGSSLIEKNIQDFNSISNLMTEFSNENLKKKFDETT